MKKKTLFILCLVLLFAGAELLAQHGNPTNFQQDVRDQRTTNVGRFRMTVGRSSMTGGGILKDRNVHYITYHGNDDTGNHAVAFNSRGSLLGFGASNGPLPDVGTGPIVLPGIPTDADHTTVTGLYTKYPFQTLTIDGEDKSIDPFYEGVMADLPSDQIIEQTFTTSMEISVNVKAYVWGEPRYDEFAILHYEITNNSDTDYTDFILTQFLLGQPGLHVDGRHEKGVRTWANNFYGSQTGEDLKLWYWFDCDDPATDKDDEGNPHVDTGEFLSPIYWGWGLIHADTSPTDRTNNVSNQPSTTYRSSQTVFLVTEDEDFYTEWAATTTHAAYIDPDSDFDYSVDDLHIGGMTIGPYDVFAAGETLNFVFFCGMGGMSIREAQDLGAQWKAGEMSDAQKNAALRTGRDQLLENMRKAIVVWENNLKLPEGQAPAPPSYTTIEPGFGVANISWGAVSGNVSYDVYRTQVEEEVLSGGAIWERYIYDNSPTAQDLTTNEFEDSDLILGDTYYNYVVAKDNNTGLQSSHYFLRSVQGLTIFAQPSGELSTVRVVPNPYYIEEPAYSESDRIIFAGLPGPCVITIFTQSGDLVDKIEHTEQRDIHEWDQVTRYNQRIQSGIYVYHVKSTEGLGEKIGKFVVVR